jgi:hypothetical protein
MNEEILVNGIDALTGRYLPAPGSTQEFAMRAARPIVSSADLREIKWKLDRDRRKKDRRSLGDNIFRRQIPGVDPLRLDSAGWCVIFAPEAAGLRDHLRRLLDHRKAQAGPLYREVDYSPEMPTKARFLQLEEVPQGQPNPAKLPYYVLLVGDPRTISFRFQYELDVQYAVGRLWLERPKDYKSYADAVVDTETATQERLRARRLTFFGVSNDDDRPTARLRTELIEPLSQALHQYQGWEVRTHLGTEAKKECLYDLLGGPETPALLFTGSHGLGFRVEEERLAAIRKRQLAEQGALICQDWPGPKKWKGELLSGHYYKGADLRPEPDLRGLIAFQFACYSGGTPELDNFADEPFGEPPRIASEPFVARLPQRLLAGGALAVVAHVDRAWTTTFSPEGKSDPKVFESTLKSLLSGEPLGWATEYLNQRYSELAAELSNLFEDKSFLQPLNQEVFNRVWRANNDARNFVVLGDPAVRLLPA